MSTAKKYSTLDEETSPLHQSTESKTSSVKSPWRFVVPLATVAVLATAGCFVLGFWDWRQHNDRMIFANTMPECSYHGHVYPDQQDRKCQCLECYEGPTCAVLNKNKSTCTVDVSVADLRVFYPYWDEKWLGPASVAIPSWYRADYPAPLLHPLFGDPLSRALSHEIINVHGAFGNANTTDRTIIVGLGSTQTIQAILYAISKKEGKQMYATARPPFYPPIETWCKKPSISEWVGDNYSKYEPADMVEILTYPNNPNGEELEPLVPKAKYRIYDMVYYWPYGPNLTNKMRDDDIMVFSLSKMTGQAATRVGWALIKDQPLALKTIAYYFGDTYAVPVESQYKALGLLRQVMDGFHSPTDDDMMVRTQTVMRSRWERVQTAFENQKLFVIKSVPNTFFLWIKCNAKLITNGTKSCQQAFKDHGIAGEYGDGGMQGIKNHIRIMIGGLDYMFDMFLERLPNVLEPTQYE